MQGATLGCRRFPCWGKRHVSLERPTYEGRHAHAGCATGAAEGVRNMFLVGSFSKWIVERRKNVPDPGRCCVPATLLHERGGGEFGTAGEARERVGGLIDDVGLVGELRKDSEHFIGLRRADLLKRLH